MRLVDTHNHLDFPDFDADRAALLQRSRALGVERQVVLGVYRENWQRVWDLAQAEDGLYAALGLHPVYLARHRPQHLDDLRQWLQRLRGETKLCAVARSAWTTTWNTSTATPSRRCSRPNCGWPRNSACRR